MHIVSLYLKQVARPSLAICQIHCGKCSCIHSRLTQLFFTPCGYWINVWLINKPGCNETLQHRGLWHPKSQPVVTVAKPIKKFYSRAKGMRKSDDLITFQPRPSISNHSVILRTDTKNERQNETTIPRLNKLVWAEFSIINVIPLLIYLARISCRTLRTARSPHPYWFVHFCIAESGWSIQESHGWFRCEQVPLKRSIQLGENKFLTSSQNIMRRLRQICAWFYWACFGILLCCLVIFVP